MAFPALRDEDCTPETVERLQTRHEYICRMKMLGMKHVDIARVIGCTPATITNVLGKDAAQVYLDRLTEQAEEETVDIATQIHKAAINGIELLDDIISGRQIDADVKQRQAAALEVLKMDGYSPVQRQQIDHRVGFIERVGMENIGKRAALLRNQGIIDVMPGPDGKLQQVDGGILGDTSQ